MAAETGFEIDGTVYEVPTLDTLNMDEAQVLYDYSGVVVEDFLSPLPEASDEEKDEYRVAREHKLRNPGVLRALMHIAYQRGNPDVKASTVKGLVSKEGVLAALVAFAGAVGEDELPPASTTELEPSSPSGSVVSSTSSGLPSARGSVERDVLPVSTGPGRSDTSSTSAPILSAV